MGCWEYKGKKYKEEELKQFLQDEATKTRRILEVQSDLFQKGRDVEDLITKRKSPGVFEYGGSKYRAGIRITRGDESADYYTKDGNNITAKEFMDVQSSWNKQYVDPTTSHNKFLRLLNKDNNWVSFFVKSIVQDSAKKSYEKVLFPTGNTAAKVEGHQTLEDYTDTRKVNIKHINEAINKASTKIEVGWETLEERDKDGKFYRIKTGDGNILNGSYGSESDAQERISFLRKDYLDEIKDLKRSKETFERELEEAQEGTLKIGAIHSFYETQVANILKKNGYNPTVITDEYGNTWNEIVIKPEYLNTIMLQQKSAYTQSELTERVNKGLEAYIKANNISIEFLESLKLEHPNDPVAVFNVVNNTIKVNQNKAGIDTLPEELAHHLGYALGESNTTYNRALNLAKKVGIKELLGEEYDSYYTAYNGNTKLLAKEALEKMVGKAFVSKLLNPLPSNVRSTESGIKLWETIKVLLNRFISLFKPNNNIMSELQKDVDVLADMLIKGEKVGNNTVNSSQVAMFQLDRGTKENINKLSKTYREQYKHYSDTITKFKKEISKYYKRIDEARKKLDVKEMERLMSNIEYKQARIVTIQKALDELLETGSKQQLINLAEETLTSLDTALDDINSVGIENYKDFTLDYIRDTLEVFKYSPDSDIASRANNLRERFNGILVESVRRTVSNALGREVSQEEIDAQDKDIFVGVKNFGTLVDVNNHLAATIGDKIKKSQLAVSIKNKKSYDDVNRKVEALHKYSVSKGIPASDMYKIFIQEYTTSTGITTTMLTRPYTSEFYEMINKSFNEMEEQEGKDYRKSIAYSYNSSLEEGSRFAPKEDKYYNKDYNMIKTTPELERFYTFFKESVEDAFDELPVNGKANFIPNVVEQSFLDLIKNPDSILEKFGTTVKDSEDYLEPVRVHADDISEIIPMRYLNPIESDKKTRNLGDALLKFLQFTNNYSEMSEVLPQVNLLLAEIEGKEYLKKGTTNVNIDGKETDLYKMASAFIDMQVKGKMKDPEAVAKYADFLIRYTSLLRIGLDPMSAVSNVFIGKMGNNIEAWGGRYFNRTQLHKAEVIFAESIFDKDSKLHKIIKKLNPLSKLEDYENLEQLSKSYEGYGRFLNHAKSLLYLPQKMGEVYLQTSTMIASMLHDTIEDKEGNKVSLWDAFKDGEWDTEKFGELTEDMQYRMSSKIKRINEMIHGRYSSEDAATISRRAFGRMAFLFKKWIPSAIESRFGEKKHDIRLGDEVEGRYNVIGRLMANWFNNATKVLKGDLENLNRYQFTETDVYNMRKNLTELTLILATVTTYFVLGAAGDDDSKLKRMGWYKFIMTQLDRVSTDLYQFSNPSAALRTFENWTPVTRTLHDLIRVITYMPYTFGIEDVGYLKDKEYQKGKRKGENKGVAAIIDATPIVRPFVDLYRINKDTPYEKPQNR